MGDYLPRNRVSIGDVRDLAARLEPDSVQTIVTSPPYFGLRDYGTATWEGGDAGCSHQKVSDPVAAVATSTLGGGKKTTGHLQEGYKGTCARCGATRVDKQLGMEATPAAFVANLVAVFAALRPALKPDGLCFVNLGDSFLPDKNQALIPHRFALAMQDDGWILRSTIVWEKPNCMPESMTDRPTQAHEYVFMFARNGRYFFDADAIREPHQTAPKYETGRAVDPKGLPSKHGGHVDKGGSHLVPGAYHPNGRNKRSVWTIPSAPTAIAHFACFPPDLVRPCVLSGSSAAGECANCGKAWARVVEREATDAARRPSERTGRGKPGINPANINGQYDHHGKTLALYTTQTTGWAPQCQCPPGTPTRPQVVLDPFLGSGTTAAVAFALGRDWQGIDLDERALKWTADRLAKFPVGMLPGLAG